MSQIQCRVHVHTRNEYEGKSVALLSASSSSSSQLMSTFLDLEHDSDLVCWALTSPGMKTPAMIQFGWFPDIPDTDEQEDVSGGTAATTTAAAASSSSSSTQNKREDEIVEISLIESLANAAHLQPRTSATLSAVNVKASAACDVSWVELSIKDTFVTRSDQWRVRTRLIDSCIYLGETIALFPGVFATVKSISTKSGQPLTTGLITTSTHVVFRSRSAKFFILIQMSRDMWNYGVDGNLHYERVLVFLHEMFARWKRLETTHSVTMVVFSRTCFGNQAVDDSESHSQCQSKGESMGDENENENETKNQHYSVLGERGDLTLGHDDQCPNCGSVGCLHEDYYHTVLDNAVSFNASVVLSELSLTLKNWTRSRLEYRGRGRRRGKDGDKEMRGDIRLKGHNTPAVHGNVMETLNLVMNDFDHLKHDRDLWRTQRNIVLLTPGQGYWVAGRHLCHLAKQRAANLGIGCDTICLNGPPLHKVPLLEYRADGQDKEKGKYTVPVYMEAMYTSMEPSLDLQVHDSASCMTLRQTIDQSSMLQSAKAKAKVPQCIPPMERKVGVSNGNDEGESESEFSGFIEQSPEIQDLGLDPQYPFLALATHRYVMSTTHSFTRRRWVHVSSGYDDELKLGPMAPKWSVLCEPALLPITTDYLPNSKKLLSRSTYTLREYDLIADEDSYYAADPGAFIEEMVNQRLQQGYQLIVNDAADAFAAHLAVQAHLRSATATASTTASASVGDSMPVGDREEKERGKLWGRKEKEKEKEKRWGKSKSKSKSKKSKATTTSHKSIKYCLVLGRHFQVLSYDDVKQAVTVSWYSRNWPPLPPPSSTSYWLSCGRTKIMSEGEGEGEKGKEEEDGIDNRYTIDSFTHTTEVFRVFDAEYWNALDDMLLLETVKKSRVSGSGSISSDMHIDMQHFYPAAVNPWSVSLAVLPLTPSQSVSVKSEGEGEGKVRAKAFLAFIKSLSESRASVLNKPMALQCSVCVCFPPNDSVVNSKVSSTSVDATGPKSKAVRLEVDVNFCGDRREWLVVKYDSVYHPSCVFRFDVSWLVCSAPVIEKLVQMIQRKARLCGLQVVRVPTLKLRETEKVEEKEKGREKESGSSVLFHRSPFRKPFFIYGHPHTITTATPHTAPAPTPTPTDVKVNVDAKAKVDLVDWLMTECGFLLDRHTHTHTQISSVGEGVGEGEVSTSVWLAHYTGGAFCRVYRDEYVDSVEWHVNRLASKVKGKSVTLALQAFAKLHNAIYGPPSRE